MTRSMRMFLFLGAILSLAAAPASAQFNLKGLNLDSIAGAVKGVAQSQEVASMSVEQEISVGRDIAGRTLAAYPPVKDQKLQRYLNGVGLWVAMQSEKPDLPWRFAAVESSQVNAFAVPGGTVLITTGMLNLLSNEAELACVMGHEIGHVVRRHHLDLLQKELLVQSGKNLVSSAQGSSLNGQLRQLALGEGSQLFTRSLDRGAEHDADDDGVLYAARAGYDPGACQIFMQRMAGLKQETGALAALYKTHPKASERVADVDKAIQGLDGASAGSGARPALGYKR